MISGADDPATFPANATKLLGSMPNAVQIVVPASQHVPTGPCVDELVAGFIAGAPPHSLAWHCPQLPPAPPFAPELPAKLQGL